VVEPTMDPVVWLRKHVEQADTDLLREMVGAFVQTLMSAEVDALCGASYGERSLDRTNRRNGYRDRDFDTRTGTIELSIPKLREGSYFPGWLLEPRRRAERALVQVVAECYVKGVSTRRVDGLIKTLGIEGISKSQVSRLSKSLDETVEAFRSRPLDAGPYTYVWMDALVLKCREAGRIANVAAVVATAANADGHREILGLDVLTSEDGAGWTAFLLPPAEGSTKPRLADMRDSFSWSAEKRDSGHLIAPPERLSTGRAFRRGREWVKLPDAPDRPISAQTVRFASAANEPFRRNA